MAKHAGTAEIYSTKTAGIRTPRSAMSLLPEATTVPEATTDAGPAGPGSTSDSSDCGMVSKLVRYPWIFAVAVTTTTTTMATTARKGRCGR